MLRYKADLALPLDPLMKLTLTQPPWVPRLLMQEMKDERVRVCKIWLDKLAKEETWFDNVITLDEAWMYYHEPAMKQATSCWLKKRE